MASSSHSESSPVTWVGSSAVTGNGTDTSKEEPAAMAASVLLLLPAHSSKRWVNCCRKSATFSFSFDCKSMLHPLPIECWTSARSTSKLVPTSRSTSLLAAWISSRRFMIPCICCEASAAALSLITVDVVDALDMVDTTAALLSSLNLMVLRVRGCKFDTCAFRSKTSSRTSVKSSKSLYLSSRILTRSLKSDVSSTALSTSFKSLATALLASWRCPDCCCTMWSELARFCDLAISSSIDRFCMLL
mmetsp:Transcript_81850/g.162521  ORF Transcript_81850/g.162521 Transcript_81850/m.162521 type:complete len:246 (-) Transcript_81850:1754-2491(-)